MLLCVCRRKSFRSITQPQQVSLLSMPFLSPTDTFLETSDHIPADLLGMDIMKILSFYMLHEKSVPQTREFLVFLISICGKLSHWGKKCTPHRIGMCQKSNFIRSNSSSSIVSIFFLCFLWRETNSFLICLLK